MSLARLTPAQQRRWRLYLAIGWVIGRLTRLQWWIVRNDPWVVP